jgi:hypothetical protein
MADENKSISYFRRKVEKPAEPEKVPSKRPVNADQLFGAFFRAAAERAPAALALGSRLVSGGMSSMGGGAGAAIAGGGEMLAQILEKGKVHNKGRVAAEAGIGMVPFGKVVKGGKMLVSAAKGAGLSAGSNLARRTADVVTGQDREALHPKNFGAMDAIEVAGGGAMSAGLSKAMGKTKPSFAEELEDTLKAPKSSAPRLNKGTQVGSVDGKPIYSPPSTKVSEGQSGPPPVVKEAERRAFAEQDTKKHLADVDENINRGADAAAEVRKATSKVEGDINKRRQAGFVQDARNLNAKEKFERSVAADKTKAEEKLAKEAKKKADEAAAAAEVERKKAELGDDVSVSTVVTETAAKNADGTKTVATTKYAKKQADDADGDVGPKAPVAAKAVKAASGKVVPNDTWQIVDPNGRLIASVPDEAAAEAAVNAAGRGHAVIPPGGYVPPAPKKAPAAPKAPIRGAESTKTETVHTTAKEPISEVATGDVPKTVKGTPAEVKAALDEKKPPTAPAPKPLSESEKAAAELKARRQAAKANEAAKAEYTKQRPVQQDPDGVAAADKQLGPRSPLEFERRKVSETSHPGRRAGDVPTPPPAAPIAAKPAADVPTVAPKTAPEAPTAPPTLQSGEQYARFFRSPKQALDASKYRAEQSPEVASAMDNLWAQYEAASKASGKRPGLGKRIQESRKKFGLEAGKQAPPSRPQTPKPPVAPEGPKIDTSPADDLGTPEAIKRAEEFRIRADKEANSSDITPERAAAMEKEADQLQIELLKRSSKKPEEPSSGGGTTIGAGLGGGQDIMDIVRRNPDFAAQLGLGAGGAAVGYGLSDDDPLMGAIIGAGAGAMVPGALRTMSSNPDIIQDIKNKAERTIPNVQRAALLSDPYSLFINSVLAPWGAGVAGSTERTLTGLVERIGGQPRTAAMDEGLGGLKQLFRPIGHPSRIPEAGRRARTRLEGVNERGEMLIGDAPNIIDKGLAGPATVMGTGDEATRMALIDAGWTEDAAREVTLTANSRYTWGEGLVNLAKKHPYLAMLQPFSKTLVNSVESAVERLPLLYRFTTGRINPEIEASIAQQVARYGLSGGIGYTAYQIGANIDPEFAKEWKIGKIVSNMSGQYGSIAAVAFAAGMAKQAGKNPLTAIAPAIARELPLPSTPLMEDSFNSVVNIAQGQPAHPNAEHLPQRWLPRAFTPGFFKDEWVERGLNPSQEPVISYFRRKINE